MTNELKVDWTNAKVGDYAWSPEYGDGLVANVNGDVYPIEVEFSLGYVLTYTFCGKLFGERSLPTLFHAPFALSDLPAACITPPKRKVKKVVERWVHFYFDEDGNAVTSSLSDENWALRRLIKHIEAGTAISKKLHHIRDEYEVEE